MNFNEGYAILQLIEEGILLKPNQIAWMFEITHEELLDAVKDDQISDPVNRFGGQYFYRDEIELYKLNQHQNEVSTTASGSSKF